MATTTYHVFAINAEGTETELATKSKKATAVEVAREHRKATGEGVRVRTSTGTVVHEQFAKKSIKMSPKYTRTVELPEGFQVPEGMRPAYVRPRRNGVILHDAESGEYRIQKLDTGELLDETFEVTREAGARLKQGV